MIHRNRRNIAIQNARLRSGSVNPEVSQKPLFPETPLPKTLFIPEAEFDQLGAIYSGDTLGLGQVAGLYRCGAFRYAIYGGQKGLYWNGHIAIPLDQWIGPTKTRLERISMRTIEIWRQHGCYHGMLISYHGHQFVIGPSSKDVQFICEPEREMRRTK